MEIERKGGNGWVTEGDESRCIREERKCKRTHMLGNLIGEDKKVQKEGSWENQAKSKMG